MAEVIYTKKEELANSITHGIGVVLGLAALVILVVFAGILGLESGKFQHLRHQPGGFIHGFYALS